MKLTAIRSAWVLGWFSFSLSALAAPATRAEPEDFWKRVQGLIETCTLQPITVDARGRERAERLRSDCIEVQVERNVARFELDRVNYVAALFPSRETDGGDIDHLLVWNHRGQIVARRWNVLSFGDVLLGLLGGNTDGVRRIRCFTGHPHDAWDMKSQPGKTCL